MLKYPSIMSSKSIMVEEKTLVWSLAVPLTHEEVQKIPRSPGVYRLSYRSLADSQLYVFYVGKARDLHDRILSHMGDSGDNTCIKNYLIKYPCFVRFAVVEGDDLVRAAIEYDLYHHFKKPRCNLQAPEASTISVKANIF